MPRSVAPLILNDTDQVQIQQWLSAFGTPQQVALRSRIVLAAAAGESDSAIADQWEINRKTVTLWRTRFAQQGLECLWEVAPGRGRKPIYGPQKIREIVDATLRTKPKGMTQWSCRLLAAQSGVSKSTINNIWQSHNLKLHRVKTFKLSRDPRFLEKLTDVVGLYLNPPQQAIVLCVGEKSQIQALDRTQPGLPLRKGRCGTMTHDYKRNGTTTLFAALELLQGKVVGQCYERHRYQEFLKFLRRLDQEFPGDIPLHLVMDNYGTHTHQKVRGWLKRHPRFVLHFVPTSSSWLNLVERWFGELTSKRIRRGSFFSVDDLVKAIEEFLRAWNEKPKPFVWTATVDSIVEKLSRCRRTLEQIKPGCTFVLSPQEQETLQGWARARSLAQRLVQRAHIILMAAQGMLSLQIDGQPNISRPTVQLWRQRFLALRVPGLERTHKHRRVRSWMERHPRFDLHFTPTSSSWVNVHPTCRRFSTSLERALPMVPLPRTWVNSFLR